MKWLVSSLVLVFCVSFMCCDDVANGVNFNPIDGKLELRSSDNEAFIFPNGTTFSVSGSDVFFELPSTHVMVGVTNNLFSTVSSGTITCDCKKGGSGCSPYTAGGKVGCNIEDPCTKCEMTKSSDAGLQFDDAYILPVDDFGSDFMNVEDLDGQRVLPNVLLEYEPVSQSIDAILALHEGNEGPLRSMFANVFGYAVVFEIRTDASNELPYLMTTGNDDEKITCSCEDGNGNDCPYKTAKMGAIKYCDAENCQKCKMSGLLIQGEEQYDFVVNEGGYIVIGD